MILAGVTRISVLRLENFICVIFTFRKIVKMCKLTTKQLTHDALIHQHWPDIR